MRLFKRKQEDSLEIKEKAKPEIKSNKEVIEEIHDTFYTEVDRLLKEAKISNSLETDKQNLIDKCNRLKSLGMTSTKEVREAEEEISRLRKLEAENENKERLIKAINYFSIKYPSYKFITEESVLKICNKYNLVYGDVKRYEGSVPDKNLKHIEDFKIQEEDSVYIETCGDFRFIRTRTISFYEYKRGKEREKRAGVFSTLIYSHYESPLEIVAPKTDFNMEGMEIKDFKVSKIQIPDPIVLKPVMFDETKYYLIVTAWGDEASDELVVNEKMN